MNSLPAAAASGRPHLRHARNFTHFSRATGGPSGSVVGPHRVVVFPGRAAQDRDDEKAQGRAGSAVPNIYMNAAKTPLRVEVTKDKTTCDLSLKRSPGR